MSDCLLVEREAGQVLITLNRPQALNSLSRELLTRLEEVVTELERAEDLRAVVITGAGEKAFCAGADIKELKELDTAAAQELSSMVNRLFEKIANLPVPVIAAVNGYALGGGCELALACDLRAASTRAVFGQPEVGLGIIPGYGGTQRLPRLVGLARAKELIFTGRRVAAEEALSMGLANWVVAPEELVPFAREKVQEMAKNPGHALGWAKHLIDFGRDTTLANGLQLESMAFGACFAAEETKERLQSFGKK